MARDGDLNENNKIFNKGGSILSVRISIKGILSVFMVFKEKLSGELGYWETTNQNRFTIR
jgi:hypothetical protein